MNAKRLFLCWVVVLCCGLSQALAQQSTAFTYQGQLRDGGTNANGIYAIEFHLFDAATNGNSIGNAITNTSFLANGLFSVDLDFGAGAFDGGARWLEITARSGTNSETLIPRVQILSSPYALFANRAGTVASGTIQNPVFLGTTNVTPLNISVNGKRALRFEPTVLLVTNINEAQQEFWYYATFVNTIGGFSGNTVSNGVLGATIAGGGVAEAYEAEDHVPSPNLIGANYATIGGGVRNTVNGLGGTIAGGLVNLVTANSATVSGGFGNRATDEGATVSGGSENTASEDGAFVGAGSKNTASGDSSVVVGGRGNIAAGDSAFIGGGQSNRVSDGFFSAVVGGKDNHASGYQSFVGGGAGNVASGSFATVVGGESNLASGNFCFAGGGSARAIHQGSFVWATGGSAAFSSIANEEFAVRAHGGFRMICGPNALEILNNTVTINNGDLRVINGGANFSSGINAPSFNQTSDRNAKQDFADANSREVLAKVVALPIQTWTFKQDGTTRHIGPMAQDFHVAFGVGPDDKHIATVDADGVALAAIQGLHSVVKEKETEIAELKKRLDALEKIILEQKAGGR